jgi:hypothetical protein
VIRYSPISGHESHEEFRHISGLHISPYIKWLNSRVVGGFKFKAATLNRVRVPYHVVYVPTADKVSHKHISQIQMDLTASTPGNLQGNRYSGELTQDPRH